MDAKYIILIVNIVVGVMLLIIGGLLQLYIKKKSAITFNTQKTSKRQTFLSLISVSLIVAGILVLLLGGLSQFITNIVK
ncbi:hypothetical protein [Mycoplasma sp. HU2014]|uniref:hypothetical protein n=1 Tax=Mycoplasma sp. HU2014 TaxID=1664275 RepID=UPI0006A49727|nr:hypothetical protein [Mycoplasma sp. HU2014]KNG79226.1 hypothetical protein AB668_03385 [Mycoplasma sp. HU2014]